MHTLPCVLSVAASSPLVELWKGSFMMDGELRGSRKVPQWEKVVALSLQALFLPLHGVGMFCTLSNSFPGGAVPGASG